MFTMMIVDDEPIIRQGIKKSIDWSSYGINIIAEAENGQSALKKIFKLKPDILITDIRMPIINGLELAEIIRDKKLDTRVIILSGYDDFEYAKKSISLNIASYLLKPFGAEELINVVTKLKDKIATERRQKENNIYNKMLMQENIGLIQSAFIQNLLTRDYTDYSCIYNKAQALNIELNGPYYQICLIDIDDFYLLSEEMPSTEKDLLICSLINISSTIINKQYEAVICKSNTDYLITLINLPSNSLITIGLCQKIQENIHQKLNLSITISIGSICSNISNLKTSYREAVLALRQKIYLGKGLVINYHDLKEDEKNKPVFYPDNKEKELLNELRFLNKNKVWQMLDQLFETFSSEMADYSNIKNIVLRLVLMAQGLLEEMGIDIEKELEKKFKPYNEIKKYETIPDIKQWLKDLFDNFIKVIKKNRSNKYNSIVNTALCYIKENYADEISLNDIASIVCLTPNYFSRIFKEETGENFTTWLNKYRIEQAKNIIKNNQNIMCYQVSDMVGYNDYKYFSTIFKKFTTITPSQYKNRLP